MRNNSKKWWSSILLKYHILWVLPQLWNEKVTKHLFVAFSCDSLVFKEIWAKSTSAKHSTPNHNWICVLPHFVYFLNRVGFLYSTSFIILTNRLLKTAIGGIHYFQTLHLATSFSEGILRVVSSVSILLRFSCQRQELGLLSLQLLKKSLQKVVENTKMYGTAPVPKLGSFYKLFQLNKTYFQ